MHANYVPLMSTEPVTWCVCYVHNHATTPSSGIVISTVIYHTHGLISDEYSHRSTTSVITRNDDQKRVGINRLIEKHKYSFEHEYIDMILCP